ncbi:MAG: non-hydrolyzing UDP-N-acetylglucosamine 2-epimerase [Acidimicrobiia bacterium]
MTNQIHVVGARPNFMKAAPVVAALQKAGERPLLAHTGQHYDPQLSQIFFDELGMPEPDVNLGVGSGSHATQTAALLVALEGLLSERRPQRVVVYGDVNSTLATALVAAKLGIPLAHVEAGLRSFDRSMPEEINRLVTDSLADMHLTTSPEAKENLAAEGIGPDSVHFVGNPMIDTLLRFRDRLDVKEVRDGYGLLGDYGVCTLHRPSNVDDPSRAGNIVEGLRRVAAKLPILIPLHPRGRDGLTRAGLLDIEGIRVLEPIGYLHFVALLSEASLVLTDSGGIQEETTVLGVPCLTLRDNTERPITVTMGTNRLVGDDPTLIEQAALQSLADPPVGRIPPLWDGGAGTRVASSLLPLV